ncbi:MAG: hypothetical protein M3O32_13540 [Actinomycetota bacterium]|nr:hypothetical protein [Actinomycetota bacterium]
MSWAVIALLLGLIVTAGLAYLISPLADQSDSAMVWEARVALGFPVLIVVGPFWLAQGIVTLVATLGDGSVQPGWPWTWFVLAPLLGASPPATALARAIQDRVRRRPHSGYADRGVAAVQQEANIEWAATDAEPGWELRRTPPLPSRWPPSPGQPAVWLCFCERAVTPQTIEVAVPWARITLSPGDTARPSVQRLSDAVYSLGCQAVQPMSSILEPSTKRPLLEALYRGESDGQFARVLQDWRIRNSLIASHPAVAPHLPPT